MSKQKHDIKKYDVFRGTSWKTRVRKELSADFVKIDERSLSDMLNFTNLLASYIKYFETDNEEANWQEFFAKDDLLILISITNFNLEEIEEKVNQLVGKLYIIHDNELRIKMLNELVGYTLLMADTLNDLRKNISINEHTLDLIYEIGNAINVNLKDRMVEVYSYKELLNWNEETENRWRELSINWGLNFDVEPQKTVLKDASIDAFKEVFQVFFYVAKHLMLSSKSLLDKLLNQLQNNKPHIALFIAFLKLFEHLQSAINELSGKHLNYYYRDVLQEKERVGVPDKINVSFQLKKGVDDYYLEQDTELFAGNNKEGDAIVYATNEGVLVNNTHIDQICTLFTTKDNRYTRSSNKTHITGIFSSVFHRSEMPNEWASFGEDQIDLMDANRTMENARIGFMVVAPIFEMREGEREIELSFQCTPESYHQFIERLNDAAEQEEGKISNQYKVLSTGFSLQYSSLKGMVAVEEYAYTLDPNKNSIRFHFELGMNDPEFVALDPKLFPKSSMVVDRPFVQIHLKSSCSLYLHSLISVWRIADVQIDVKVKQVKDFTFYNALGKFTADNPVNVLGAIPTHNSYWLIHHPEGFRKPLTKIGLKVDWFQLPILAEGLASYFKGYNASVAMEDYKLSVSLLKNGTWVPELEQRQQFPLFSTNSLSEQEKLGLVQTSSAFELDLDTVGFEPVLKSQSNYDQRTKNGFIKLELTCPSIGFGHSAYSKRLSDVVLYNSTRKKGQKEKEEPNVPFSPMSSNIEGYYEASISLEKDASSIELIQLTPFGYKPILAKSVDQPVALIDDIGFRGVLMLGLNRYPTRGEMSIHFEMNETFYEEIDGEVPPLFWYYMSNNEWFRLKDNEIVKDTTKGFLHDGIIQFKLPKLIQNKNTVLDGDKFWLKAELEKGARIRGKITGIYENAVEATWNGSGSGIHLEEALPPNSVTKLQEHDPSIAKVLQPGESFGGRQKETSDKMIKRVSERLRHKNRALNALDYEELVLEKFEMIYKVKCFMADYTSPQTYNSIGVVRPGEVKIAVIPDVSSEVVKNKKRPQIKAYMLMDIRDYLMTKASPFVNIEVCNPFYEFVKVFAKVKFKGYESDGFYLKKLNDELIAFLNPWLEESLREEDFGKSLYKSEILGYIQERDYVDFVTGFSLERLNHIGKTTDLYDTARTNNGMEEIKTTYPWAMIISADHHDIEVINDTTYEPSTPRGIDNMELESDFVLK